MQCNIDTTSYPNKALEEHSLPQLSTDCLINNSSYQNRV